ncbi:MAG: LuxR C-terminal-related transcriptional regulator [Bryobacteraceae bacterium]
MMSNALSNYASGPKTVAVCDTQPVTIEGIRSLLADCHDLKLVASVTSLSSGLDLVRDKTPTVVLIDKAFGLPAVMDWITSVRAQGKGTATVVWGVSMNESEALRIIQAGAAGVIRKTTDPNPMLECLRRVASGQTWMEDSLLHEAERMPRHSRSNLTPREQQVVELVEQGLKNKEIAKLLGIRPGTVKIHLKHIFEKTGVRGRYGLALSGLKEKGFLSYPTA